ILEAEDVVSPGVARVAEDDWHGGVAAKDLHAVPFVVQAADGAALRVNLQPEALALQEGITGLDVGEVGGRAGNDAVRTVAERGQVGNKGDAVAPAGGGFLLDALHGPLLPFVVEQDEGVGDTAHFHLYDDGALPSVG